MAGDLPRFQLLRELGRGGMGEVHLALDLSTGRELALKRLSPGALDADALARFQREAELLARLRHPGIVALVGWGLAKQGPWLAMEYCPGGSLERFLGDGPRLAPQEVCAIGAQAARALAHAHQHGIVHRDVKPGNLLLDGAGQAKLGDIGLARPLLRGGSLTASGMILGTPAYAAPEQLTGDPAGVGPAADTYALGGTLYALLAGRPPFADAVGLQLLERVLHAEPPPLGSLRPGLDPRLERLVRRCLEKEPAARPDLPGFAEALDQLAELAGPGRAPVAARRRPGRWVAAAALVGAALLCLAVWPRPGPAAAPDLDLQAALAAHEAGDAPACTAALERLLAREPEHPIGLTLRARVALWKNDLLAAERDLDRVEQLTPGDPRARLARAQLLIGQGRGPDALACLNRVLEEQPGLAEGWLMRAELWPALEGESAQDRAAQDLRRGTALLGDDVRLLVGASGLWSDLGEPQLGLEVAERAVQLAPRRWTTWLARAQARVGLGDEAGAVSDLEQAHALAPDEEGPLVLLAERLLNSKRSPPDPQRALDLLGSRSTYQGRGYVVRAQARALLNDPAGAIAELRLAEARLGATVPDVGVLLARKLQETGDAAGARSAVEQVLARFPDDPPALLLRAQLIEVSEPGQAEQDYARVLQLTPAQAEAQAGLERLRAQRPQPPQPGDAERALQALKEGDRARALGLGEPVLALLPSRDASAPVRLAVARLACALGRWPEGLRALEGLREAGPWRESVDALREVLATRQRGEPGPAHRVLRRMEELAAAGQLEEASRLADQGLEVDPSAWELRAWQARVELDRRDGERARAAIGHALALAPTCWNALQIALELQAPLSPESQELAGLFRSMTSKRAEATLAAWVAARPQDLDGLAVQALYLLTADPQPSQARLRELDQRLTQGLTRQPGNVEALLQRGRIRLRLGELAGSRSDLDRAVALWWPGHPGHLERGECALAQGDLPTVGAELGWLQAHTVPMDMNGFQARVWRLREAHDERLMRDRAPADVRVIAMTGTRDALGAGQRAVAERYAATALAPVATDRLQPKEALLRAKLACTLGRWDEALLELARSEPTPERDRLEEVVRRRAAGLPGPTQVALEQADRLVIEGDAAAAGALLQRVLEDDPCAWEALLDLSRITLDPLVALRLLNLAVAMRPDVASLLHARNALCQQLRVQPPAADEFGALLASVTAAEDLGPVERFLERSPAHAGALALRAWLERDPSQLATREAELDAALVRSPGHPDLLLTRGSLRAGRRDWPAALADYDLVARLTPTDPQVHFQRGVARLRSGDLPGAREELDWLQRRRRYGPPLNELASALGRELSDAAAPQLDPAPRDR